MKLKLFGILRCVVRVQLGLCHSVREVQRSTTTGLVWMGAALSVRLYCRWKEESFSPISIPLELSPVHIARHFGALYPANCLLRGPCFESK